jgi:GxxExxY protein
LQAISSQSCKQETSICKNLKFLQNNFAVKLNKNKKIIIKFIVFLYMTENEISNIIIGLAIEIHKVLGPGLLENAYQECLLYKIKQRGLAVEKEKAMPLIFEEVRLDCGYRIDLLVENKLIIEIKSVESLTVNHLAQTLTYLKLGNYKLGLLINFNETLLKNGIRRVVNNL